MIWASLTCSVVCCLWYVHQLSVGLLTAGHVFFFKFGLVLVSCDLLLLALGLRLWSKLAAGHIVSGQLAWLLPCLVAAGHWFSFTELWSLKFGNGSLGPVDCLIVCVWLCVLRSACACGCQPCLWCTVVCYVLWDYESMTLISYELIYVLFICLNMDYAWLQLLRRANCFKWLHVSMFPFCVIDSRS